MTEVNPKLMPIFNGFCRNYCKYFAGRLCRKNNKLANLDNCPIGEWWDINDYLNEVKKLVDKIQKSFTSGR